MITDNAPVVTIEVVNGKPAVTSRQVAEAFEKDHDKVLRDIRNVLDSDAFSLANFGECSYVNENNRKMPMYTLSRDGFLMVVLAYTGEKAKALRKAYIIKFSEMEAELASQNQLALPADYASALRALADSVEQKQLAEAQRDEAKRTKAMIGSRREATAMATASVAVRKANDLEEQLGIAGGYRTVKSIKWLSEIFDVSNPAAYSQIGKTLNKLSKAMNLEAKKIDDPKYGSVNVYHVDVIERFHNDLVEDFSILEKYRR